jgi:hypothetical protein
LILGKEADLCPGGLGTAGDAIDAALEELYREDASDGGTCRGGLGGSAPKVARWLGHIRTYFPSGVVRVMQKDALERLNLQQMRPAEKRSRRP